MRLIEESQAQDRTADAEGSPDPQAPVRKREAVSRPTWGMVRHFAENWRQAVLRHHDDLRLMNTLVHQIGATKDHDLEEVRDAVCLFLRAQATLKPKARRRGRPNRVPVGEDENAAIYVFRRAIRRPLQQAIADFRVDRDSVVLIARFDALLRTKVRGVDAGRTAVHLAQLVAKGEPPKRILTRITKLMFPWHGPVVLEAADKVK